MQDAATLLRQNQALREQLEEAQAVLAAVRDGGVDALVVGAPGSQRVFTLEGADAPYRVFVETMAEGALIVDASGRALYANEGLAHLLQRDLMSLIGSAVTDMVSPGDREAMAGLLRSGAAGPIHAELALQAADGSAVAALVSAVPFRHDPRSGQVALVVADMRERRRAEAEIRQLNASLEERVSQRTAALTAANADLARFNAAAVGRELRMIELKVQVNELRARLGEAPLYSVGGAKAGLPIAGAGAANG